MFFLLLERRDLLSPGVRDRDALLFFRLKQLLDVGRLRATGHWKAPLYVPGE